MGRRPLAIGEHGKITAKLDTSSGFYVARCRLRDGDGVRRQLQALGKSANAATKNLKAAIATRGVRHGTSLLHSHMTLNELAQRHFANLDRQVVNKTKSVQTVRRYRQAWNVHIAPALGELLLHELSVEHCEELLLSVREKTSVSNTQIVRAVVNEVLKPACKGKNKALPDGNPMKEAEKIAADREDHRDPVTIEIEEVHILLERLRKDPVAVEREIDDMVVWMIGTGDRIGNMLAADWSYLDLVEGAADLRGVAVEHNGKMSVDFGSSKGHRRNIELAPGVVVSLQALWLERDCPPSGFVFPGKRGNPRGLGHLHRSMRQAFIRAGFPTLEPHSFRRTTATELERAGLSDYAIADFLGHDNVETTRKNYLKKRQRSQLRSKTLDRVLGADDPGATVTELHARSQGRMA